MFNKYLKRFMKSLKKIDRSRPPLMAGGILILAGLIIGGVSWLNTSHAEHSVTKPKPATQVLKDNKPADTDTPLIDGTPVHIAVPSVGISVNVIPGYYYPATKSWTLSPTHAQYATVTVKPNNKEGDTFIYAHDLPNLFYNLFKIVPGAQAIITTDNGHTFTYTFTSSTITTPSDTRLFDYKGKPILILQTCTGQWYQNRQLYVFDYTEVS